MFLQPSPPSGSLAFFRPEHQRPLFYDMKNLRFLHCLLAWMKMTWTISVFNTVFWPEWKWHEKSPFFDFFHTIVYTVFWPEWKWHEKSPFFTPFFGLKENDMKNLRFLHPFLASMKMTWKSLLFTPFFCLNENDTKNLRFLHRFLA